MNTDNKQLRLRKSTVRSLTVRTSVKAGGFNGFLEFGNIKGEQQDQQSKLCIFAHLP